MVFSIIQKSQLEGTKRLDAEYYQIEYFIDFTRGNWQSIGDILKKCQYGLSQAMNDKQIGYPIFKMDNINETFLFDDKIRYVNISESILNTFRLEKNDVLFNRVNSEEFVGRTGIFKLDSLSTFASYLIRLQTDNLKILPGYLNIFLNSKFGLRQIKKFTRRAINQANINAEELKQFKIAILPMVFQKKVEKLSNKSWNNFQLSKNLYHQAEDLLLKELGLKDFKKENSLFSIVNLSKTQEVNRIDAEYFNSPCNQMLAKIKTRDMKILGNFIENYSMGYPFKSENYQEAGIPLLRINNIKRGALDLSNTAYLTETDYLLSPKDIAKPGDIVLSMSGTIGSVAIIPDDIPKSSVNQRILKFTTKNINKDYLVFILNSIIGRFQLEKIGTGGVQTNINYKDIKNILIPILPISIQNKIADLVLQSYQAHKKAKELLEEAKSKVEEMIENNQSLK